MNECSVLRRDFEIYHGSKFLADLCTILHLQGSSNYKNNGNTMPLFHRCDDLNDTGIK